ncbi:MAG: YbaB/EbfC family nucleoid-associated protein [Planctomycetaceae bacterium]|jgi:nucleoid-associated protein EbfC|nr:YbaB/EbfC family nucleoid-associated protein [Planctomycetaceae bacterium]
MFKSISNMTSLMKKAREMGGRVEELNSRLESETVNGTAGGGMVSVSMTGLGNVISVSIDPQLVEKKELEMIEDLVRAAVNEAREKTKSLHARLTQEMTAELGIPGLTEAIENLEQIDDA